MQKRSSCDVAAIESNDWLAAAGDGLRNAAAACCKEKSACKTEAAVVVQCGICTVGRAKHNDSSSRHVYIAVGVDSISGGVYDNISLIDADGTAAAVSAKLVLPRPAVYGGPTLPPAALMPSSDEVMRMVPPSMETDSASNPS